MEKWEEVAAVYQGFQWGQERRYTSYLGFTLSHVLVRGCYKFGSLCYHCLLKLDWGLRTGLRFVAGIFNGFVLLFVLSCGLCISLLFIESAAARISDILRRSLRFLKKLKFLQINKCIKTTISHLGLRKDKAQDVLEDTVETVAETLKTESITLEFSEDGLCARIRWMVVRKSHEHGDRTWDYWKVTGKSFTSIEFVYLKVFFPMQRRQVFSTKISEMEELSFMKEVHYSAELMPYRISGYVEVDGSKCYDFPIVSDACLGDNPYIRLVEAPNKKVKKSNIHVSEVVYGVMLPANVQHAVERSFTWYITVL
ncbi:hypothetical protein CTI12_AA313550 [Artemisia annua]|uniref:Uncharacterized protein n=1 Tax=Artemisia annua TaxID=35608 RepID=A0A2U1N341_ARTAN|nr:hypothetical protein CTI12_AA313550 [Artemisia annua]